MISNAHNRLLLKDGEDIASLEGKKAPDGNGTIQIKKGIEVGHIFKLGTVYSENMGATVQTKDGKSISLQMGCYGIGVSRIVAASIEQNNDDKGIVWPAAIAPFDVNIIPIGYEKNKEIEDASNKLKQDLLNLGYDVLLDDRKAGFGSKIKDSELVGIPINIILGNKFLDDGSIELRTRDGQESVSNIEDLKLLFNHFK